MPWRVVALTENFLKDCDAAGLGEQQITEIVDRVAKNPLDGDLIRGAGGARKVRVARRGGGKSSGFRLITAYVGGNVPVYLFALYAKGERATLNQADVNALRDLLNAVKRYWKERQE
jgi:hypothetical protein